jgi:hypothetical protein
MVCVSVWDQARLSRYNFMWWDVTSLQPYTAETQFESSLLVQRSGGLALSSLSNVFHSLTTNARSIFIIMVRHQLRNFKDPTYLGEYVNCNRMQTAYLVGFLACEERSFFVKDRKKGEANCFDIILLFFCRFSKWFFSSHFSSKILYKFFDLSHV